MGTDILLSIADASGALFVGACITLGTICFILLLSPTGGPQRQRQVLQLYIVVLMFAVIGYFISCFLYNNVSDIFHAHLEKDLKSRDVARGALSILIDFFAVVVICMADGILIWRCYKVHKAFTERSSSWSTIYMAIPIGLWIASLVSGIINCTTDNSLPATILFTSNMLTSIYGTCFITIRLWLYRRMVRHCFGDKVPMGRYNDIMGMLLKSAAIYVPIAICVSAESMPTANVTPGLAIVCSIFAPCQGLASILIIYQVALGRATGQRNQEEATLVTEKGSHGAVIEDTQIRLLAA